VRGFYVDGLRWIDAALALDGDAQPALRAAALHGKALLSYVSSDPAGAAAAAEACVALRRGSDDREGLAPARNVWSMAVGGLDGHDRAREIQQECLDLSRALGDAHLVNLAVYSLGLIAMALGELDVARAHFVEGLAGYREAGNAVMVAVVLFNLG